jgi:hypothetical protein
MRLLLWREKFCSQARAAAAAQENQPELLAGAARGQEVI